MIGAPLWRRLRHSWKPCCCGQVLTQANHLQELVVYSQKSTGPFQAVKWKQAVTGPWTDPYQDVAHPRHVYILYLHPVYRLTDRRAWGKEWRHLTTKTELRRSCKMETAAYHKRGCWSKKTAWKDYYIQSIYLWTEKGEQRMLQII